MTGPVLPEGDGYWARRARRLHQDFPELSAYGIIENGYVHHPNPKGVSQVDEFKGNEPQSGVTVPAEMTGDRAPLPPEPGIGKVISFRLQDNSGELRLVAATRSEDGLWRFTRYYAATYTWPEVCRVIKDRLRSPIHVMTEQTGLHL